MIDFTGTHPGAGDPCADEVGGEADEPGHQVEQADAAKRKQYDRFHDMRGTPLIPVAIATAGRMCVRGVEFLSQLAGLVSRARVLRDGRPVPYSLIYSQVVGRLSVVWQRGNARLLRAYRNIIDSGRLLGHLGGGVAAGVGAG